MVRPGKVGIIAVAATTALSCSSSAQSVPFSRLDHVGISKSRLTESLALAKLRPGAGHTASRSNIADELLSSPYVSPEVVPSLSPDEAMQQHIPFGWTTINIQRESGLPVGAKIPWARVLEICSRAPVANFALYFPPGVYIQEPVQGKPSAIILEQKRDFIIIGTNAIIRASSDLPAEPLNGGFVLRHCQSFSIKGIAYDGSLSTRTPVPKDLWAVNLQHGFSILEGCVDGEIAGCSAHFSMMDGFFVGAHNGLDVPKNITLHNSTANASYRQGLSVVGVDGLLIRNSIFSGTGTTKGIPPSAGIDLEAFGPAGKFNINVKVDSCVLQGNNGAGIYLHDGTRGAQVLNCTVINNRFAGVCAAEALVPAQDCVVDSCIIENNGLAPSTERYNVLWGGTRNSLVNSTISSSGGFSLLTPDTSRSNRMISNTFLNTRGLAVANSGNISIGGRDHLFEGNTVLDTVAASPYYPHAMFIDSPGTIFRLNTVLNRLGPANPTAGLFVVGAQTVRLNRVAGWVDKGRGQIGLVLPGYASQVPQVEGNSFE